MPTNPPDELCALIDAFRADLADLWSPETALERHEVENIAQALARQRLLDRVEERVLLSAMQDDDPDGEAEEPARPARPLPSLDSLVRYRRRLGQELAGARDRLQGLKEARSRLRQVQRACPDAAVGRDGSDEGFAAPAGFEPGLSADEARGAARSANPQPSLNRAQRRRSKALRRKTA